ncbi:Lsr2 family DNA-binding protein [Nonomuraea glycinis]|uniref:Lsr2 family DNA-binding protein n=1 Tax=Nonomuraea glycinis TaxID=2047744 RepID=UPI0033B4ABEA
MTAAIAERPAQQGMTPDIAHALLLLAQGHTSRDAAAITSVPLGRLVGVARRQGWTIHPSTQLAVDPAQPDNKPVLASDIAALAATWQPPKPSIITPDEHADIAELADADLFDAARTCDDRKVQHALQRVEEAITRLRTAYAGVAERAVAEAARAAQQQQAAARVAELEQQLAAARRQVKDLRQSAKSGPATSDGAIRAWAKSHGIPVSERGRLAEEVRRQYDAAHPA